ncbi:Periplasmic mercury ion-binding protein [Slackia heliotrinireducens]|uniref:Putative metal-binding protein n=1 Tax=Slackia heliotrinireducens (strain ATCC 29202 / DSM 20476 / NCTC 11029 / RHS 1) TaxID=471855 RepID=C7N0X3_SLAHD|nr:heavy metal-associated domain-containing protein [Slackia heliotrinireducens]ACV21201.1 putative metal-binding protein [Slackia heliotrinireducens DSM 20476]VEG98636.1 Periplasmic mercury ion-binding protein [Slackia heliotrinireducens]
MQKTINVEGMMCVKCEGRVTKALNALEGVEVIKVSHEENVAVVEAADSVADQTLVDAVVNAGYAAAMA